MDKISTTPERLKLPVKGFQGEEDPNIQILSEHWKLARETAESHGYRNVTYDIVPATKHSPMASQVLVFFASLSEK